MSRQGPFSDNSKLPELTKELQTAIALDPNFADPYMLLAFAQTHGGDPAAGLVSIQKAVSLSPRNENYQLNLAQMYLSMRKADEAIAILQSLRKSANASVAARAQESFVEAQAFQAASKAYTETIAPGTPGQLRVRDSVRVEAPASGTQSQAVPDKTPPKFLKGVVKAVDCSSPPIAILTVVAGTKSWHMQVPDSKHVLLIGADDFSCSWDHQRVALNYRPTGDFVGNVISIEVQ